MNLTEILMNSDPSTLESSLTLSDPTELKTRIGTFRGLYAAPSLPLSLTIFLKKGFVPSRGVGRILPCIGEAQCTIIDNSNNTMLSGQF